MQEFNITFPEGIFGFGEYHDYLPLPVVEGSDAIINLQCVEDDNLSFVIMNPFLLLEDYQPVLSPGEYEKLGTTEEEDLSYYVICVVREPFGKSTVNLKCPLVVNSKNRKALQVMLDNTDYGMRVCLDDLSKKEGD